MGPSRETSRITEILVVSGKGGTGKTTVLGSFAALADHAVLADCDVDAANLHLLLHPVVEQAREFIGLPQPRILLEKCQSCGACIEVCRFGAIEDGQIDPYACESCGLCAKICPYGAIVPEQVIRGRWFTATTSFGPLVYARLNPGEQNSGLLVAEVKKGAREAAAITNRNLVLTDGPPGIGCPVVSALSDADIVLVVAEPTISGLHDLQRTVELGQHFGKRLLVCVNKADIHTQSTEMIVAWCRSQNICLVGQIPFDEKVATATFAGQPVVDFGGQAALAIEKVWKRVNVELHAVDAERR